MIQTSATATTRHFENGREVFPCRCGEVHRGDYAAEKFIEHECFHDSGLLKIGEDYFCVDCGAGFTLEGHDGTT